MDIDHYSFGRITIQGETYTSDVIIFHDRVFSPWWRREGHLLHIEDLSEVMKEKPEVLIIGKGYAGVMKVPQALADELKTQGIDVIVERTTDAVNVYNHLSGREKVAALHLTC